MQVENPPRMPSRPRFVSSRGRPLSWPQFMAKHKVRWNPSRGI